MVKLIDIGSLWCLIVVAKEPVVIDDVLMVPEDALR